MTQNLIFQFNFKKLMRQIEFEVIFLFEKQRLFLLKYSELKVIFIVLVFDIKYENN